MVQTCCDESPTHTERTEGKEMRGKGEKTHENETIVVFSFLQTV